MITTNVMQWLSSLFRGRHTVASQPWVIISLTMAAVIFAALATGRGPDRETHEATLTALRAVDVNAASLQRDVLQSRYGILQNYDPIVASIVNLHKTMKCLRTLLSNSSASGDTKLWTLLDYLDRSVAKNEEVVEGFKTKNSLLQNSLQIFGRTLGRFHAGQDPLKPVVRIPTDLSNQMMQFSMQPSADLAASLRQKLESMTAAETGKSASVQSLVSHGLLILSTLPEVDRMVADVQASITSVRAQNLQKEYLEEYGRLSLRASWSRIFLGSISVALCGYVVSLIYRLRRQTDRLKRKLDFEAALSNLKSCFDNAGLEHFAEALKASLQQVRDLAGADAFQFSTIHQESGEVEETYGSAAIVRPSTKSFRHQVLKEIIDGGAMTGFSSKPVSILLPPPSADVGCRRAVSGGLVLGLRLSDRLAGVMALEYDKAKTKPDAEEIGVMAAMMQVILQNIDQHKMLSEREILERRLEHAERLQAVGTLAGGIAHEFNNILGAMLGYAEMALHSQKRKSPTSQFVQEIISAGERAKKIIDQILTLSRRRERITKPIDVVEIVSDILPLLQISLRDDVALSAKLPDRKAVVLGNPLEIQQIAMNLCKNAAEAIGAEGKIELEVSVVEMTERSTLSHGDLPAGCWILLSVSDNGSGIPEIVLPHIFEPFFTTRTHQGGTGLGLAAVHGNVVALSGHVDVRSEPDMGTQFRIYLPLCRRSPVTLSDFFVEAAVPVGRGEFVGVLERDQTQRMMYEEKLAALGYEPIGFSDVISLDQWLNGEQSKLDLLIIDSGSIQASSPGCQEIVYPRAPYIVITPQGRSDPFIRSKFADAEILRKPVSAKALANAVHDRIQRRSGSLGAEAAENPNASL
ncbi:two-component system VirA-like sensor kinase [Rhizobium leguminosarum]|uniref:two-component system VirA-like sensor kinase n=1 Tax=Rhizobium leguminosarum TaxID=384 RepID=UPI00143F83F1|nr:two-component system VirA-like sensor kinase [Rhizobium leguminosarum]NKL23396.1 two-component system VirA-like sensor kinase [Rhizobium leguminosarum bv. viciae]